MLTFAKDFVYNLLINSLAPVGSTLSSPLTKTEHVMPLYRKFTENKRGRDFIVGDLHGCRFLLEMRLSSVGFDPKRDRVFSVGDLISRGPASLATLSLIAEEWFFAVVGNHEDMLLSYLGVRSSGYHRPIHFMANGGDWFLALSQGELIYLEHTILPLLLELPYINRVGGKRPFNVVHAELDACFYDINEYSLKTMLNDQWIWENRGVLTWSRGLAKAGLKAARADNYPGGRPLDLGGKGFSDGSVTYAGHTILPYAIRTNGHVFLDGGAYCPTVPEPTWPVFDEKFPWELRIYNHTEDCFI